MKVTKTTGQYVYGQLWANINNANTIVSSYVYNSSTPVVSTALKDAIIAALSTGNLYLGSLSLVEGANNSYANLELRIIVDYTLPPANVSITVDNNFTASGGTNHGTMIVDGTNRTIPLTGYTIPKTVGQNLPLSANSPQNDNQGYQRIWHNGATNTSDWRRNNVFKSNNQTYSFTVASDDDGKTYVANLRKILNNVVFQNNFIGVGNGGVIKVNGIQYNSPKIATPFVELNSVTGAAVTQTINGIQYTFDHWNDGSTTSSKTYNPGVNTTYTAYYTGKPLSYTVMNTHFNDVPGQNVIIYWNDHPNTNVTHYKIWRKVKHNGVMSEPYLIATKNRGTTTYTDDEYVITRGYTDDLLYYDVRPYYSVENTFAEDYYLPIFAEIVPKTSDSTEVSENLPEEFSISCYPNPFNPSTNISVTMPTGGLLQVVIYNVLGEEILQLKNEMVTKGSYNLTWDGKDSGFNQVNSGIYIVLVKTEDKMISQKIVLLR